MNGGKTGTALRREIPMAGTERRATVMHAERVVSGNAEAVKRTRLTDALRLLRYEVTLAQLEGRLSADESFIARCQRLCDVAGLPPEPLDLRIATLIGRSERLKELEQDAHRVDDV